MMNDENNNKCRAHSGIDSRVKNLEEDNTRQWDAIEKLQNRLPIWATFTFSALTFFLGAALTYAALAIQIARLKSSA